MALVNDPGVEAEPFLYQSAYAHLKAGREVVYVVFNRAPSTVRRGMAEYGFDPAPYERQLHFVDAYSPLMGSSEGAPYTFERPGELGLFSQFLERLAKKHRQAVLLLDPLSSILDHATPAGFRQSLEEAHHALQGFRVAVALLTRWPYGDELTRFLEIFDCVINLKSVEDRVIVSQYFMVDRAAWRGAVDKQPVLYRTLKPGGVFAYIPKIVVTGAHHAGKSTFVRTLSDTAVSADRLGTTVAIDHGHVTIDGLTADLFGTAGQARFDPLLKRIAAQALGVILVVDSTRPDTFERAREMMQITGREGIPIIVAANKQDVEGALPPPEVAKRLQVPSHVRVVGTVGNDKESVRALLRALIDQIMLRKEAA